MSLLEENAREIAALARDRYLTGGGKRIMIAIAGAPGSGKSTLADAAVEAINHETPGLAAVFPMDGFHYDDRVLDAMGRKPWKGAPDTFDANGLYHMLLRLRANEDDAVAVPVFDRDIEIARAAGRIIEKSTGIIVCEGNYLLLDRSPWDRLKPLFDYTVLVDVSAGELRNRLRARWQGYGLTEDELHFRVEESDLANALVIAAESSEPDRRIPN